MVPQSNTEVIFKFEPTPGSDRRFDAAAEDANSLGPLADLQGTWEGSGFNAIWRPVFNVPNQDRFLELNLTRESIKFDQVLKNIPNRGLLQQDVPMNGLTYFQQISDVNTGSALHIEPGIWAVAPPTSHPDVGQTVIRMASIPHGTAILAQGKAARIDGPLSISKVSLLPFPINPLVGPIPISDFGELNLLKDTLFRTDRNLLHGITQEMVDDPNSVLRSMIKDKNQEIISSTVLEISTLPTPVPGGGSANTAFLMGDPPTQPNPPNPNAFAAQVTSIFWIETVKGKPNFLQLQYSQTVLLNFNTLSWPHVSVGTLRKVPSK